MSHNDHSAHADGANGHSHNGHSTQPDSFDVRVLRQDGPGQASYWQRFRVPYERDMNVISVLQRIAAIAKTVEDDAVRRWPGIAIAWRKCAALARWSSTAASARPARRW